MDGSQLNNLAALIQQISNETTPAANTGERLKNVLLPMLNDLFTFENNLPQQLENYVNNSRVTSTIDNRTNGRFLPTVNAIRTLLEAIVAQQGGNITLPVFDNQAGISLIYLTDPNIHFSTFEQSGGYFVQIHEEGQNYYAIVWVDKSDTRAEFAIFGQVQIVGNGESGNATQTSQKINFIRGEQSGSNPTFNKIPLFSLDNIDFEGVQDQLAYVKDTLKDASNTDDEFDTGETKGLILTQPISALTQDGKLFISPDKLVRRAFLGNQEFKPFQNFNNQPEIVNGEWASNAVEPLIPIANASLESSFGTDSVTAFETYRAELVTLEDNFYGSFVGNVNPLVFDLALLQLEEYDGNLAEGVQRYNFVIRESNLTVRNIKLIAISPLNEERVLCSENQTFTAEAQTFDATNGVLPDCKESVINCQLGGAFSNAKRFINAGEKLVLEFELQGKIICKEAFGYDTPTQGYSNCNFMLGVKFASNSKELLQNNITTIFSYFELATDDTRVVPLPYDTPNYSMVITPHELSSRNGETKVVLQGLPTEDEDLETGQVWNNNGRLCVSPTAPETPTVIGGTPAPTAKTGDVVLDDLSTIAIERYLADPTCIGTKQVEGIVCDPVKKTYINVLFASEKYRTFYPYGTKRLYAQSYAINGRGKDMDSGKNNQIWNRLTDTLSDYNGNGYPLQQYFPGEYILLQAQSPYFVPAYNEIVPFYNDIFYTEIDGDISIFQKVRQTLDLDIYSWVADLVQISTAPSNQYGKALTISGKLVDNDITLEGMGLIPLMGIYLTDGGNE